MAPGFPEPLLLLPFSELLLHPATALLLCQSRQQATRVIRAVLPNCWRCSFDVE